MKQRAFLCLILAFIHGMLPGQSQNNAMDGLGKKSSGPDTILIDRYELEGVVMSADKRGSRVMDVPASVTTLSGSSLDNGRIISTTKLTGPVPNLYMPDYGSRLTSPVYIRGIGSRINAPSVGFYVDEVALFEKASFNFDLYDIQRIEILRGPQGTLYGRNTMGGIVHVITRDPDNRFGLRLLGELGSYGHRQYQLMVEKPVVKDKFFIQLNGNFRKRNGFHTNQYTGKKVDRLESGGGRLKFMFTPTPGSKIIWQIHADLSDEGGYPYAVVSDGSDDLVIDYDHQSSYERELLGTSLQYERKGSRVLLNSITAYRHLQGFQDIDQDFTAEDRFRVTQDQDQHLFTQEFRISNPDRSAKITWLTGLYGFYQANDQLVEVNYGEDGLVAYNLPYQSYAYVKQNDRSNYGLAFFGQGTLKNLLIDPLSLTAGIRADYELDGLDYNYDRFIDNELSRVTDFKVRNDFFEILPKIALKYRWSAGQINYISMTRGYKSGGFNTSFEREEDRAFYPEYSWNYEAGWKSSFADRKLNLKLAVFYIDWKNLQVYQPVPGGRGSMLKNAASAFSRGTEIEISAVPLKNWVLTGSFGYADAKFRDFAPDPDEAVNYGGNKVPYVPDYTGFVCSSYRIPFHGNIFHEMVLSLNWQQTGRIFWNDANEYVQEPYGLMAANLGLKFKKFDLRVWAENILDTPYRSFQFTAIGNVYAQPGKPRTAGITLSCKL